MRIRSTKPEFWRSDRVAACSWDARLVLKALESFVDDNGVGKDDLELIVGDLFMRDLVREPSRTLARVSEAISELHQAGLVWRYEADGTDLLYLAFWESVQRIDKPQAGRFRRPDGTLDYKESLIRECVANGREESLLLAPGTGEQGNRGTEEQALLSDESDDLDADLNKPNPLDRFEEFWDTFGNKVKRPDAERKWVKALAKPGVTADLLISAAASFVAWERANNEGGRFIGHPSTWLHNERWADEPKKIQNTAPQPRSVHSIRRAPSGMTPLEYAEWEATSRAAGQ